MKKLFFIPLIVAMSITSLFAQVDDRIVVNKKDLPPDLVQQLESKKDLEKYAEYVGVGKEIGIAISEGLKAVVDEADHFSNTNVGLFTMILIGWSIVGRDLVQIIIGVPIFFIGLFIMIRYYRKTYFTQKVVTEKSGFFLWPTKKYTYRDPEVSPDDAQLFIFFVCALIWTAVCMLIIFV